MPLSTMELVKAREAAKTILEEIILDAYIFEVEPHDDHWDITIECACAIDGSWKTVSLQVPKQYLLDGFDDTIVKQRLFEYWKKKLDLCKLRHI